MRIELKKSTLHGDGVFAKTIIHQGEVIDSQGRTLTGQTIFYKTSSIRHKNRVQLSILMIKSSWLHRRIEMKSILALYIVGFLFGIVLGVFFPTLVPTWMVVLLGPLGIVIISEAVGSWGFGRHWNENRVALYVIWPTAGVFMLLGFLFGTGEVGSFLVTVGTLFSR